VTFLKNQRRWKCYEKHPRPQFSIKVGTIFEDSPLGLEKWLPAVWMIVNDKNGISSYEVARALGITQKSAWFMMHRIRVAMQRGGFDKMNGDVEVDETFIGGKARFMHPHKRAAKIKGTGGMGKTAVMGLLERHGPDGHSHVRVKVVPNTKRKTLAPEVRQNVTTGASVYTDALASYDDLGTDYVHQVIDHAESYVRGKVHTNGLENFWSLLKRGIKGTYVSVEPWHLAKYLDEQVFRFNERRDPDGDGGRFVKVLRSIVGRRLTYKELIGQSPALA
jgi:transposase-like protein